MLRESERRELIGVMWSLCAVSLIYVGTDEKMERGCSWSIVREVFHDKRESYQEGINIRSQNLEILLIRRDQSIKQGTN